MMRRASATRPSPALTVMVAQDIQDRRDTTTVRVHNHTPIRAPTSAKTAQLMIVVCIGAVSVCDSCAHNEHPDGLGRMAEDSQLVGQSQPTAPYGPVVAPRAPRALLIGCSAQAGRHAGRQARETCSQC